MNKQYIQWPKSTIIKIKFSREWTDLTTLVPKIKRCHLNSVHAQHFLKMPKCQWREIHLRIKLGTTKEQLSVAHRPTSLAQSFPSLPDLTQWIIMLTQELFAQWCRRPLTDKSENMKRVCIIERKGKYRALQKDVSHDEPSAQETLYFCTMRTTQGHTHTPEVW